MRNIIMLMYISSENQKWNLLSLLKLDWTFINIRFRLDNHIYLFESVWLKATLIVNDFSQLWWYVVLFKVSDMLYRADHAGIFTWFHPFVTDLNQSFSK